MRNHSFAILRKVFSSAVVNVRMPYVRAVAVIDTAGLSLDKIGRIILRWLAALYFGAP